MDMRARSNHGYACAQWSVTMDMRARWSLTMDMRARWSVTMDMHESYNKVVIARLFACHT